MIGAESCLVIKMRLPLGLSWLWVPYGRLEVFEKLADIAKKERSVFARIEPLQGWPSLQWRSRPSPKRFTPEHTLMLDLTRTEDTILAEMKPKGRYNIGVAKRHGVTVQEYKKFEDIPPVDFEAFYSILKSTSARDGFGIHPKFFYEELLKTFGAANAASLVLAYKNDVVIAGAIIIFYGKTATYYYGGSDYEHRSSMAPYLVQFSAIQSAKQQGMLHYDFLGIAPDDGKNHPWAGVTDFKRKFGGQTVTFPKAFDVVYRPIWYWLLRLLRRL